MNINFAVSSDLLDGSQWVAVATNEGIQYKGQLKYLPDELGYLNLDEIWAVNEFDKIKYDVTPKVAGWLMLLVH